MAAVIRPGARRRAWALALLLATGSAVAGCGDDRSAASPDVSRASVATDLSDSGAAREPVPYALLTTRGWSLEDAVDPPPDDVLAHGEPVPSSWWAMYQRLVPTAGGYDGRAVRLTGLTVGLDSYRSAMEALGLSFVAVDTTYGAGLAGTTAEQGARPVVVAVPFGPGTLELLSYELSADELVVLLADVQRVDGAAWQAAGGQLG